LTVTGIKPTIRGGAGPGSLPRSPFLPLSLKKLVLNKALKASESPRQQDTEEGKNSIWLLFLVFFVSW
jgi:hypothetical protein